MDFLNNLLFLIFPKTCEICGKIGNSYLCEQCKDKLEKNSIFANKIIDYSNNGTKYFDEHAYIFEYNSIIRKKIIQYKFGNKAYLSEMFSEFFVKNEKICGFLKKYDIIIPVPMTNKKIRKRGYNQTQLIAKIVAKNIETLTLENNVLVKYKENKVQSKLTKLQRAENVKNVYKLQDEEIIKGKNVLILDDVYTTGATCSECARILKKARPSKIGIITIAKDYGKIQTKHSRKD